jgi:hypothetical protein
MLIVLRLIVSLLPLALTPVLGYLLAQGYINLGGGEKDILMLLPWMVWSIVFGFSSWVFWRRGHSIPRSSWRSVVVGLAGLAILGVTLTILGQLGIGGLF